MQELDTVVCFVAQSPRLQRANTPHRTPGLPTSSQIGCQLASADAGQHSWICSNNGGYVEYNRSCRCPGVRERFLRQWGSAHAPQRGLLAHATQASEALRCPLPPACAYEPRSIFARHAEGLPGRRCQSASVSLPSHPVVLSPTTNRGRHGCGCSRSTALLACGPTASLTREHATPG